MKNLILPAIVAALLATSCTKTEKTADSATTSVDSASAVPENQVVDSATVAVGDTTENSVDWNGTYSGTLPCASCPGIETTLTLNADKSYTITEVYKEEKDGKFEETGTFKFDESGSFITLDEKDNPNVGRVFFVGENQMWMVKKVGDRDMKDEYRLEKK